MNRSGGQGRRLFLEMLLPRSEGGPIAIEGDALHDALGDAAALAVAHNLFMLFHGRVRRLRDRLLPPDAVDLYLEEHRQLFLTGVARIERREEAAVEAAGLLRSAGLPFVEFRGGRIARDLYGDGHSRLSNDIDLLVREDDVPQADEALRGAGFLRSDDLPLKFWMGRIHHASYRRRLTEWSGTEWPVEIHWHFGVPGFFRLSPAEIWKEVEAAASPEASLSPGMDLIMILMHHHMHFLSEMRPLVDIIWALEKNRDLIDWDEFAAQVERIGLVKTARMALIQMKALWAGLPGARLPVAPLEESLNRRGRRPAPSRLLERAFALDLSAPPRVMKGRDRFLSRFALDSRSAVLKSFTKTLVPSPEALEALFGGSRPRHYLKFLLWRAGGGGSSIR